MEATRENAKREYTPCVGIGTGLGGLGYRTGFGGRVETGFGNVGHEVDNFGAEDFATVSLKVDGKDILSLIVDQRIGICSSTAQRRRQE